MQNIALNISYAYYWVLETADPLPFHSNSRLVHAGVCALIKYAWKCTCE